MVRAERLGNDEQGPDRLTGLIGARALAATLLVLFGASLALARLAPPVIPTQDIGVTELYVDLASRARLDVGPYSRFGWHHPGPLYFYLQAPLYAASGRRGAALYAGAAAINLAALAALLLTILSERRPWIAAAVAVSCLTLAWRLPRFLASPWTAHIPVLPFLAFLVLAAAVASGRTRRLAAATLAASLVVQTNVALGPAVAVVAGLLLGSLVMRARYGPSIPRRDVVAALAVSVVAWLPSLIEAARHRGGNVLELWRFFTTDATPPSPRDALSAWAYGLAGIARADFTLPWGRIVDASHAAWPAVLTAILLALVGIAAIRAARGGRAFEGWLAGMLLGAAFATLWALMRVRGEILDYQIFFLAALGAMAAACAAATLSVPSARAVGTAASRLPSIVAGIAFAATIVLSVTQFRDFVAFESRLPAARDIEPAVDAIDAYLDQQQAHAALVDVDTAWSQAVPIILRLRQQHRHVAVSHGNLFMFTEALAARGDEAVRLTIQPGRRGAGDGRLLFDSWSVGVVVNRR